MLGKPRGLFIHRNLVPSRLDPHLYEAIMKEGTYLIRALPESICHKDDNVFLALTCWHRAQMFQNPLHYM